MTRKWFEKFRADDLRIEDEEGCARPAVPTELAITNRRSQVEIDRFQAAQGNAEELDGPIVRHLKEKPKVKKLDGWETARTECMCCFYCCI